MGSKRKLAPAIIDHIIEHNPNAKYFYDLFGGGGAVSFEALRVKKFEKVFYNEIDSGVVTLLKKIRKDGVTPEFYQWIDRETFFRLKDGKDWKSGLVKTCWSFGNKGCGYLYGKKIEKLKKAAHDYLFEKGYRGEKEKRIKLLKDFKKDYRLEQRLQLQHLQNLEHLQRLQHLERLVISNKSFEEVEIATPANETVVYLDPPYKGTAKYQNDINHQHLKNWIHDNGYKIYVSGYNNDYGLNEVCSWRHRSILSATNNSKKVYEKLFCNYDEKERRLNYEQ